MGIKTYVQTVDLEEKKIIWKLYFAYFYNYEELSNYFNKKYTYHQLKSIILERLELENNSRMGLKEYYGNTK